MCDERKISPAPSAGYQNEVNAIPPKDRLIKALFERSYELEMQAKGMRRLAELIGAAGPHDAELFLTVKRLTVG